MNARLATLTLLASLAVLVGRVDVYAESLNEHQGTLGKEELGLTADLPLVTGNLRSPARVSISETRLGDLSAGDGPSGPIVNRFAGAFDLGKGPLTASVATTVERMYDPFQSPIQSSTVSHSIIGTLQSSPALTIEPALNLRRYQQQWTGVRVESPSATLGLTYTPNRMWSYRLDGGYTETLFAGGGSRLNTFTANSGVTLRLNETRSTGPSLSLDTTYSQTTEAYQTSDPLKSIGGMLRLQVPIN